MAPTKAREWIDEDTYWREEYRNRPYASNRFYDEFSGAYRYGYDAADQYRGRSWNEVEKDLEHGWEHYKYKTKSAWHDIKDAVRDAWNRMTS